MEQFVLTFTRSGRPRLERVVFDPATNRYAFAPVPRESETAARAAASPAGQWFAVMQAARRAAA